MFGALFIMTAARRAVVPGLAPTGWPRRWFEQRRIPLQEATKPPERVGPVSADDVEPDKFTTWRPSPDLTTALPQATCAAEVNEEAGPPKSRRIRLLVTWPNATGQMREPVAVTLWKFAEAQP